MNNLEAKVKGKKSIYFLYAYGCVVFLFILFHVSIHHDYGAYHLSWLYIEENGSVSKSMGNAYGPLFYFFYLFHLIHIKLPSALFFLSLITSIIFLVKKYPAPDKNFIIILFLLSPLVVLLSIKYGNNDTFYAGLLLLGLIYFDKKHINKSGIVFGIAISIKFIPILFIPFIIRSMKIKEAISFLTCSLSVIVLSYLAAYFVLDLNVLTPIDFGLVRESKMMSIFRFFRGKHSITGNLDAYSVYILAIGYSFLLLFSILKKWPWKWSVLTVYLWLLSSYKVVHHQYYLPFFCLVIFVLYSSKVKFKSAVYWILLSLFIWINITVIAYPNMKNFWDEYEWIRDIVSVPTFIIQIVALSLLIKGLASIKMQSNE